MFLPSPKAELLAILRISRPESRKTVKFEKGAKINAKLEESGDKKEVRKWN